MLVRLQKVRTTSVIAPATVSLPAMMSPPAIVSPLATASPPAMGPLPARKAEPQAVTGRPANKSLQTKAEVLRDLRAQSIEPHLGIVSAQLSVQDLTELPGSQTRAAERW